MSRTLRATATAFSTALSIPFVSTSTRLTSPSTVRSAFLAAPLSSKYPRVDLREQSLRRPRPYRRTMVATTGKPGVLDTDNAGGVLLGPRSGSSSVSITFAPELASHETAILVLGVWAPEGDDDTFKLPPSLSKLPSEVTDALNELIADAEFSAKAGSSTDVMRLSGTTRRVVLYGLGKKSDTASSAAAAGAASFAMQKGIAIHKCESVSLFVDEAGAPEVTSVAEGAILGAYVDERYKEKKETSKVPKELVIVGASESSENSAAVAKGSAVAMGIITTKDLVSAPANCLTPATMAAAAEMIAKETGLTVKILGRAECEKLGMGLYLGVGRGSTDEPKFIHMTYTPPGGAKKKVCIVGKSVTFDTGGTNLKTGAASMIELMKFDMGGGAVTLGTAKVIGEIKPKDVEVHFIMPAVENMIGDRAIHPGDILKGSNDKTVEVINTDAEGRLCLADALVYAENLGDVDYVVDIATLTGAIIVSLGNDVAGMWCSSDEMADTLAASFKATGEKIWRMPLVDEYAEQMKSKIADLRNIGTSRGGGSIIAALFLREFVKTKNWAHLDIAGTVWADKKGGATGYGVKSMVKWIESLQQ